MGGSRVGALDVMAEQVTGRARRGVVAAAAPLAAQIGATVMRAGGTAYDAVVAAGLAETVLLPPKCGLGGDLVALRLRAGADVPEALLAIGGAPAGLLAAVESTGGLPEVGGLSVGPPAAPAGYAALAAEGTWSLAELVAPAVELARDGFPWSAICTWLAEESRGLLQEHQPDGTVYLPGGRPPEPGQLVRLPGLASVLEELAARGSALFEGPVGDAVVERVRAAGGVLDRDDLAAARAEWVPCDVVDVAGWTVWATPAPTHGVALLDALVAAGDRLGPADLWAPFMAATARRRAALGDTGGGGTSMVSAAEAGGDAIVLIHSNSFPQFGSGLVVPDYDLVLNNRAGRGFTSEPDHPNAPVPGRRPATTLHAWSAGPAGHRPSVLGGTPGGANQVSWNLQTLAALLSGERDPGRLVAGPRWEWLPATDAVVVEEGFDDEVVASLASVAPGGARDTPRWGLRCAQQVVGAPREADAVWAAVDPRTGGAVAGV